MHYATRSPEMHPAFVRHVTLHSQILTSKIMTMPRRSPLGLVVLWLLFQEPMHVYRMQKLIEHQAKDRVVNVRSRASLYQTIDRLTRLGLVEVHETVRSENH